jgi:hypothetical protein
MSNTATTAAIVSANTANAAAANAEAQKAAYAACMSFVRGYEHDKATVQEMREYAGCIERLQPDPRSNQELMAEKACVLFMFLAIIGGVVWQCKYRTINENLAPSVCFGFLFGFLIGAGVLSVVIFVTVGVRCLLS